MVRAQGEDNNKAEWKRNDSIREGEEDEGFGN